MKTNIKVWLRRKKGKRTFEGFITAYDPHSGLMAYTSAESYGFVHKKSEGVLWGRVV